MQIDEVLQYGQAKAQEIQERRQRRRIADEKASVDGRLKTIWAPRIWEQIREEITQLVHSINEALGEDAIVHDEDGAGMVIIRLDGVPSNLSATFDPNAGRFILTLNDHIEAFNLEVVRGEVKLKAVGYFSPRQLAKMLVDKAASMVL